METNWNRGFSAPMTGGFVGIANNLDYQGNLNRDFLRQLAVVNAPTLCRRRCPECECALCTSCPCDKCKIGRLEQRVAELEGAK